MISKMYIFLYTWFVLPCPSRPKQSSQNFCIFYGAQNYHTPFQRSPLPAPGGICPLPHTRRHCSLPLLCKMPVISISLIQLAVLVATCFFFKFPLQLRNQVCWAGCKESTVSRRVSTEVERPTQHCHVVYEYLGATRFRIFCLIIFEILPLILFLSFCIFCLLYYLMFCIFCLLCISCLS